MSWGDALGSAYNAATDVARQAGASMMSSAASAANAVSRAADAAAAATARTAQAAAQAATRAAVATRDAAVAAATATSRAVTSAAAATHDAAVRGARMAGNAASFGGRAVVDAAGITGRAATGVATAPYRAARNLMAPASTPAQTLVEPCPDTWAGKKARLEKRQQMIRDGQRSPDPDVRAAADRFQQNNQAVELARLSKHTYPEDPPVGPPPGWSAMSADQLRSHHIDPQTMDQARAVMYETPDDWPGGKRTVLAFRGTFDLEDGIVDHDQAMAVDTKQYQAAVLLGNDVSERMGEGVLVTGHSLGGGKAQAAGAAGGLKGIMFNSAGLHPDTVNGKMPGADQFTQYRTPGDPLTGTQNSPAVQAAIIGIVGPLAGTFAGGVKAGDAISKFFGGSGLSPDMADYADKAFKALPRSLRNVLQNGDVMPPAIGPIHEVDAVSEAGNVISRLNVMAQHSIKSAINGIEKEKTEDMAVLAAH